MHQLLRHIDRRADEGRSTIGQPRFATVTSFNPSSYEAKVLLRPEGVETDFLPVLSQWVGAGWGLSSPPSPGQQVLVEPAEGDLGSGVIIGGLWSDARRTPGAPVGELWLVHQSGASLKLTNDGKIVTSGPWQHTGALNVSGALTVGAGASVQGDVHVAGSVTATGAVSGNSSSGIAGGVG